MILKIRVSQQGFTLVELAIVLVIIGVLLGSFIGSLASRIETTQRNDAKNQLEDIKTAILGFASAEGRLPCPAGSSDEGEESPVGGGVCDNQHGFVPGKTLGLSGSYNRDSLLLDVWGNPIRYSVTNDDNFTTVDGIKASGMGLVTPNLTVCNSVNVAGTACFATANELITKAPFVLISLGKDGNEFVINVDGSTDQGENAGENVVVANVAGENLAYTVGNDNIFVSKEFSAVGSTAGQFDDLIVWVSPYILYSRMIEAGQLP